MVGSWFLCGVPSIEVFPGAAGQAAGTKKAVAGRGDCTSTQAAIIQLGPLLQDSGFASAGHQLLSGCEHRL